jgi:hypothetical protein
MECARCIIVSPSRGIGERVVGVVDLLELLRAGVALRAIGGDAVGVVFQGGFFVRLSYLVLICCWGELEDFVVVYWRCCWALDGAL